LPDELERVMNAHIYELEAWTRAWYEEAIRMKYIQPPFSPDCTRMGQLRYYFRAGFSPAEAVQASFGTKH
jgi:hypothetical protein